MVHGDCSSRGCYAMTDEQMAEIYSLGRESCVGGRRAFQSQAYPFKMTPINMAKHRTNPNMPFWKMIKEGYDHFEVTRQEPKVDFCEKKYVFDAAKPPNATKDPVFDASAQCPAYVIPDEIAEAVRQKQQDDQAETAKLISKGTPVARTNTGIDGGMNKVFAAKLPDGSTGLSEGGDGQGLSLLALSRAPGTIPSHVNPPRMPKLTPEEEPVVAASSSTGTRVASPAPPAQQPQQSEGFFSSLARKVGLGGADAPASAPPPPAKPKVIEARRSESAPSLARATASAPKPAEPKHAPAKPALKPSVTDTSTAAAAPAPAAAFAPAAKDAQVTGSAPIVSSNSFESRFGAVK